MASNTPRIDRLQKNYLINGDMRIAQRHTTFVAVVDSAYTLDRYQYVKTGAMVHTITQDTDVPTLAESNYLFQNSLRMNLTTPDTAIAASDYCMLMQKVEGYNFANLAQKDFTLSFWVKATLPGIYNVSFGNSAGDQAQPFEYTINTTNTWEKKTLHITASPASGTWNYVNGIGLYVRWTLAAGTNFQFTGGVWGSGNRWATANQVNGVNTGATDFRLTGAMLCEGHVVDPEFSIFGKDFLAEVQACQRYYEKSYELTTPPASITGAGSEPNTFRGYNAAASAVRGFYLWKVIKRTGPTPTFYSGTSATPGNLDVNGAATASAAAVSTQLGVWAESASSFTGAFTLGYHVTAEAEL